MTSAGNFEGQTVLQRHLSDEQIAAEFDLPAGSVAAKLGELHKKLLVYRSRRVRPATDDKVLVSWNALMLQAFAEAGRYLSREDYTQYAARNANFLLTHLRTDNRLQRSWRGGNAAHNAYLEDHAALILGLVALYQADPQTRWFTQAISLAEEILAHFQDPSGGFFDTRHDHQELILRPKDTQDNATPSGNALAALALLQLSAYTDNLAWRSLAEQMLQAMVETATRYPTSFGQWLTALDFAVGPVQEAAILGEPDSPAFQALVAAIHSAYRPRLVAALSGYPPEPGSPTLVENRPLRNEQPTAYVCQGFVCQQPVTSPEEVLAQLQPGTIP